MTFSDDDLRRLKERLNTMLPTYEMHPSLAPCEVLALIARLEAAEKAVEASEDCDAGIADACEMRELWKAWRKAAGK